MACICRSRSAGVCLYEVMPVDRHNSPTPSVWLTHLPVIGLAERAMMSRDCLGRSVAGLPELPGSPAEPARWSGQGCATPDRGAHIVLT